MITVEKELEEYPNIDTESSLPFNEEDLMTLDEFRRYFEKRVFERLGFKITL